MSFISWRNDFFVLLRAGDELDHRVGKWSQAHPEARRIRSFTEVTVVRCVPIRIMDPTIVRTSNSVLPKNGNKDGKLMPPLFSSENRE